MEKKSGNSVIINVNLSIYGIDIARYAAWVMSGEAYVRIKSASGGTVAVEFSPKGPGKLRDIAVRFRKELEEEKVRSGIFELNRKLREALIAENLSSMAGAIKLAPRNAAQRDLMIARPVKPVKEAAGEKKRGIRRGSPGHGRGTCAPK